MLNIESGLIFWTVITFIVLLIALSKAAWKPLITALTSREEKIRTDLQEAEAANQEAKRLLEENKRNLAQAEQQAQSIIKEGRTLAEQIKNEIVDKAHQASRQMIEQAKEEIGREKESALMQLRTEVADLAVGAASKIIDANLDPTRQQTIVDEVIKGIKKN
jgi:F-type H+-transporting ATPase subunit b